MTHHPPADVAVPLDELSRPGDLARQLGFERRSALDRGEPPIHPRVLLAGTVGDRAQGP